MRVKALQAFSNGVNGRSFQQGHEYEMSDKYVSEYLESGLIEKTAEQKALEKAEAEAAEKAAKDAAEKAAKDAAKESHHKAK